jgi:hypothetical protein
MSKTLDRLTKWAFVTVAVSFCGYMLAGAVGYAYRQTIAVNVAGDSLYTPFDVQRCPHCEHENKYPSGRLSPTHCEKCGQSFTH